MALDELEFGHLDTFDDELEAGSKPRVVSNELYRGGVAGDVNVGESLVVVHFEGELGFRLFLRRLG